MLDYDIEHEDGVRRAMNLQSMYGEITDAFASGNDYCDLQRGDVFIYIMDNPGLEKSLHTAVCDKYAAGNPSSGNHTMLKVVDLAIRIMLEDNYTRIMNAKQEEAYNEQ